MKFFIKTLGCRVNQAESREIAKKLVNFGFRLDKNNPEAVVLNTCVVTKKAEKEVRQEIRRLQREYPGVILVVTGCAVDLWRKELKTGSVLWVENKKKRKIPELILKKLEGRKRERKQMRKRMEIDKYAKSGKAIVKVQDGCNQFCTYCIVPYLRGRSRSIDSEKIVEKIKKLEKEGIKEVILTGVNLADYQYLLVDNWSLPAGRQAAPALFPKKTHKGPLLGDPPARVTRCPKKSKNGLVRLIRLILVETGIKKISFGSIGLGAFDEEFFKLYRDKKLRKRLAKHFHIPLQSGSDKTLKRMGRKYKISNFKSQISKIRKKIPRATFSTDVMVGFPGETRREFKESLRNIKEIGFKRMHVFRYSYRPGTVAAKMEGRKGWEKVEEKEKKRRSRKLRKILSKG